jgi:hypothetical protein
MIYRNISALAMAAAKLAAAVCFGAARVRAHDANRCRAQQPPLTAEYQAIWTANMADEASPPPDLRRFNPAHP